MTLPSSQTALAGLALIMLSVLGGLLVFHAVPTTNQTMLATIVGALAGALTVAGGQKLADKLSTTTTGDNAVITPNPTPPKEPTP
jgi:outer membrane lipoprotein SlyB